MNSYHSDFALVSMNNEINERQVMDTILACNKHTQTYGFILNEQQALSLTQTRTVSLKENKRIEFGNGIVEKLILAICDSPYITQDIYEDTLHEWIHLFYDLKNHTWDEVSDRDLIDFMKTAFNGCCHGSMDLLWDKAMQLTEHIHCGNKIHTFSLEEE